MTNAATASIVNRLSPQAKTVFNHMKSTGSISGLEAYNIHRVRSLTRRMTEIRDALGSVGGYGIRTERKKDVTGQRYVRYHLVKTK